MASALGKGDDEHDCHILKCDICKQGLNKPKLLSCQHSFCTQCLINQHGNVDEGETFCCPTCQNEIQLDNDTVESIPDNYIYDIVKEADGNALHSNTRCTPCSEGKQMSNASHKCLDCGDTLCRRCSKWHCRFTATKHHVVVALSDLRDGKFQQEFSTRKVLHCDLHSTDEHKVPLSSYCDDCKCLVCVECTQVDHKQHSFSKIKSVREKQQQTSDDKFSNLARSLKDQDKRRKNIEKAIIDSKQEWGRQETEIYDTATELYAMVDKIKDEKLTELKSHYEKEMEYLKDVLEKERNKLKRLQATVALTKMFLKKCSDSDFLYHEDDIKTRMDTCQRGLSKGYRRNVVTFEKQETGSVTQAIGNVFGRIESKQHNYSHKCRIGQVEQIFHRNIAIKNIYGISYNPHSKEILIAGNKVDSSIDVLDENGYNKSSIKCENSNWCSDIHYYNSDIYFTVYLKHKRQLIMIDQNSIVKRSVVIPDDDQETNCGLTLVVDYDNTIFIASYAMHRIYKWTPGEEKLVTFKSHDIERGLYGPEYVCLTPSGELVVSNFLSSNIQIYSMEGGLQWQYDGKEEGHELKAPRGVCCDKDGYIYVVDKGNSRIQVIHDQKLVGMIPIHEEAKEQDDLPLIITPDGHLIYGYKNNLVRISVWENDQQ